MSDLRLSTEPSLKVSLARLSAFGIGSLRVLSDKPSEQVVKGVRVEHAG